MKPTFALPDAATALLTRTTARIGVGRAGSRPTTDSLLQMRLDHAAACDAVHTLLPTDFVTEIGASLELHTLATDRQEYLLKPHLGRQLTADSQQRVSQQIPECSVLIAVGDGLSCEAVRSQVPLVLPVLHAALQLENVGVVAGPVFVHRARVGVMNELGAAANAQAVVLLIGERPGLSSAESLSIYMGYRPRPGCTDADRIVLSNVHGAGIPPAEAGAQAAALVATLLRQQGSGVAFKP